MCGRRLRASNGWRVFCDAAAHDHSWRLESGFVKRRVPGFRRHSKFVTGTVFLWLPPIAPGFVSVATLQQRVGALSFVGLWEIIGEHRTMEGVAGGPKVVG